MLKFSLLLSIALTCVKLCGSYKILVAYPFPAGSHNNLGNGFIKHLLRAGHEVTYITPFPSRAASHPNLRIIDVSAVINAFQADVVNINYLMHNDVDLNDDNGIFFAIKDVVAAVLTNENVQKLLNDPKEHFDVVVNEWMFNELYSGFSLVFDCPYIWTLPYEPYVNVLSLIDEAPNPAYIPNMVSNNVPPFSFYGRVQELWSQIKSVVLRTYYQMPYEIAMYEEVFGSLLQKRNKVLPPYDELRYNASMMLGLWHVSMGQPMRLPQNFKSIAGFYIDYDVKPLPEDLQKIMDNAQNGVIYFSLGSNLKSKDLPEVIQKELVKMFGELKEEVLWKFEAPLKDLPKNVHIIQWAPQQSVLAHPNCKLFITHGGLLSTTESVHFGVPTIGIPVFADQFNNVDRAVQKGSARRVDLSFTLAQDLRDAIREMISDPRYMIRARELSMIYHDRPASPGAELVHWVEHVVRTRGATHLRSPALSLPFYQKMYLDLATVVLVLVLLAIWLMKYLIPTCFAKKKSNVVQKKKIK